MSKHDWIHAKYAPPSLMLNTLAVGWLLSDRYSWPVWLNSSLLTLYGLLLLFNVCRFFMGSPRHPVFRSEP